MAKKTIFLIILFCNLKVYAQQFIPLWPAGKKPGSKDALVTDSIYKERLWRVGTPGMYAFTVAHSDNKGTTVLICPGGGYDHLNYLYNGFNFAKWFNAQGINVFVLIYRLPTQADLLHKETAPVQDVQRAMRMLKANAIAWHLDPKRIGVMGISSGGHVATTLATYPEDVSSIQDSLDKYNYHPDFMILVSPVVSMGLYAHKGSVKNLLGVNASTDMREKFSNELHVSSFTPPTFIVHAQNDSTVPVQNSILFYNALVARRISASLHVFPQGGHDIKLVDNPGSTDLWLSLLDLWLRENGFVDKEPRF